MAIRDIRFSFEASTPALSRDLNWSLYGFFCNDPAYQDEVIATIDFVFRYDEPLFLRRGWQANLVDMFSVSRARLSQSSFPQLRWFSQECLSPPEEADFAAIAPHLIRWQEYLESLSGGKR